MKFSISLLQGCITQIEAGALLEREETKKDEQEAAEQAIQDVAAAKKLQKKR